MIVAADAPAAAVICLCSGIARTRLVSRTGRCYTLRFSLSGEALGLSTLFDAKYSEFETVIHQDATLCRLPKQAIERVMENDPEFLKKVSEVMASRLRQLEGRAMSCMSKSVTAQIAAALIEFTERFSGSWTRRDLAEYVGTSTETVIRVLSQFRKKGLIEKTDHTVLIANKSKLEHLATRR